MVAHPTGVRLWARKAAPTISQMPRYTLRLVSIAIGMYWRQLACASDRFLAAILSDYIHDRPRHADPASNTATFPEQRRSNALCQLLLDPVASAVPGLDTATCRTRCPGSFYACLFQRLALKELALSFLVGPLKIGGQGNVSTAQLGLRLEQLFALFTASQ